MNTFTNQESAWCAKEEQIVKHVQLSTSDNAQVVSEDFTLPQTRLVSHALFWRVALIVLLPSCAANALQVTPYRIQTSRQNV